MVGDVLRMLLFIAAAGLGLIIVSFLIDALRSHPKPRSQLRWAPDIEIKYLEGNAGRMRYIKAGQGPVLVLLHTLRTQLDLFEKVVPELAKDFTVYALDLPGHARGRGIARSSWIAPVLFAATDVPVLGETVMRLRSFPMIKAIFNGGMAKPERMPPQLLKEMYSVANRPGHFRAFLSLIRNSVSWQRAAKDYTNIQIPVLLIWGKQDWARPDERDHDQQTIPGAKVVTVERGGHFLPLDRPDAILELLRAFKVNP